MQITRRHALQFLAASLPSLTIPSAWAQHSSWPSKPIRIIVAFPPGGGTTIVARIVGEKLSQHLGQSVIIDNKPGANGIIAMEELLKAPADGHTLCVVTNTHSLNPVIQSKLPYDTLNDFVGIGALYGFELLLTVTPSIPVNDVLNLATWSNTNPGKFSFATGDTYGITYLASEMYNLLAGTKIPLIPYKGGGQAIVDVMGGHAGGYFGSVATALPYVKAGKLKALAISGKSRVPTLPDVPTFAESGMPKFDSSCWAGVFARAGTPVDIITKLNEEINAVMASPEGKSFLSDQGLEPLFVSSSEFNNIVKNDIEKFREIVKKTGMKIE